MDEAPPDVGAPDVGAPDSTGPDSSALDATALDRIETELADVDVVLACLDRTEATRCEVCEAASADGSITSRAALRLCSLNRRAAGDDPDDEQLSAAAARPTMPATELAGDGGRRGTV